MHVYTPLEKKHRNVTKTYFKTTVTKLSIAYKIFFYVNVYQMYPGYGYKGSNRYNMGEEGDRIVQMSLVYPNNVQINV